MKRAVLVVVTVFMLVFAACATQEVEPAIIETTTKATITIAETTTQAETTTEVEATTEAETTTGTTAAPATQVSTTTTRPATTCGGRVYHVECVACGAAERGCRNECIRECSVCGHRLPKATPEQLTAWNLPVTN